MVNDNEEMNPEDLPDALKQIIHVRASNAGNTQILGYVLGASIAHFGLEAIGERFFTSSVIPDAIAKQNPSLIHNARNSVMIASGAFLAFEALMGWLTCSSTYDQTYQQLSSSYAEQYPHADRLIESSEDLPQLHKTWANINAIGGGIAGATLGLFGASIAEAAKHKNDASFAQHFGHSPSSIIPSGAVPWITAAVLGAVSFAVTRGIAFQNFQEEVNCERTDISFVKRLEEQRGQEEPSKNIQAL